MDDVDDTLGEVENDEENETDVNFEKFLSDFEASQEKEESDAALAIPDDEEVVEEVVENLLPDETPVPDKGADRGVERVAAKEKELREERAKFDEERKAWEVEKQSTPRGINPQDLISQLDLHPEKVLAQLGVNAESLMKKLLLAKLDDSNPAKAKLREQLKENEYNRKFADLEEKLASKEREVKANEEITRVTTGAEQYVEGLKSEAGEHVTTLPTVSKIAKADPKFLHAKIMKEIKDDATTRFYVNGETSGDPISYAEASKRVEADLAVLAKLFTSTSQNAVPDKTNTKGSKSNTVVKPSVPSRTSKPLTIEDLEERAIQSAIKEFHNHKNRGGYSG